MGVFARSLHFLSWFWGQEVVHIHPIFHYNNVSEASENLFNCSWSSTDSRGKKESYSKFKRRQKLRKTHLNYWGFVESSKSHWEHCQAHTSRALSPLPLNFRRFCFYFFEYVSYFILRAASSSTLKKIIASIMSRLFSAVVRMSSWKKLLNNSPIISDLTRASWSARAFVKSRRLDRGEVRPIRDEKKNTSEKTKINEKRELWNNSVQFFGERKKTKMKIMLVNQFSKTMSTNALDMLVIVMLEVDEHHHCWKSWTMYQHIRILLQISHLPRRNHLHTKALRALVKRKRADEEEIFN